jgi:hypothetical protein
MDDLEFMLKPQKWPKMDENLPYLCVVRGEDFDSREHGFILAGSWEVNLGYVFDGGTGQFIDYKTPQDVLNDGWSVD